MTEENTIRKNAPKTFQVKGKLFELAQFLFPFVVISIFWEISVRTGYINVQTISTPSMIFQELYDLVWKKGVLQYHFCYSIYRLALGYILAVILGISIGTVLALQKVLRDMFSPILSLLISVPTIAWVPVLLITTGLGDQTVITAIFLGGVFEIIYSTIIGIRAVDAKQIYAAQIMGVKGLRLFYSVILPSSLVSTMPALRLSMGYCWRALVGAEMLSAMIKWGIGKMIFEARFWNDVRVMFVGLMVIGVFGVFLDRLLLRRLEQHTIEKWGMVTER